MNELEELNLEKIIWIIFIILSAINIYGDNIQQLFLIENNPKYEKKNTISIYIYYNNFYYSIPLLCIS